MNILGNEDPETTTTEATQEAPVASATISAAPFSYSTMVGEDGGLSDNWREGLPEDIRGEKCLDSIKHIGALAKSYVLAQKSMGSGKVAIPTEHSTKEEWDNFYKATGRPDSADGYSLDGVKDALPEGVSLDDDEVKSFRDFAFANGISQKGFDAALKFDIERVQRQQAAAIAADQKEYADTIAKLQADYGPQMNAVVAQCNKAMDVFGLKQVLEEKGLLNNYTIIKALAGIGARISESRLIGDGAPSVTSPQDRLNEIRNNPDDPFNHRDHPAHKARVEEVGRLLAAISKMG